MSPSAETVQIALIALVVGVALPLLVQLFIALRSLQKIMNVLDRRLEPTFRDLSEALASLKQGGNPSNAASVFGAALVPAVIAGIRALRSPPDGHLHSDPEHNGSSQRAQQEHPAGGRP